MAWTGGVNPLRQAAADYLEVRRALGFKLRGHDRLLDDFIDHLERTGAATIAVNDAVRWATARADVTTVRWGQRLSVVRGFALHLRCADPTVEVPPNDLLGHRRSPSTPYPFSDADIGDLIDAAGKLRPALRAATHQALFGLLAVSGMRIGEAIGLDRTDVDLDADVVQINDTKFRKHRQVPLHATTAAALSAYARTRDQLCPAPKTTAFFVSTRGTRLLDQCVHKVFRQLVDDARIVSRPGLERPRVHGLRHSFAVATLRDWHLQGADPAGKLPLLSAYLGHADPAHTYHYLHATPELLATAADRLQAWEASRR